MTAAIPRERELVEPVDLCRGWRHLNPDAIGWSRTPLHRCNLRSGWLSRKRWNYWAITTEDHVFSVTLADLDYAGLVSLFFADFDAGKIYERNVVTPFGRKLRMPPSMRENLSFRHREMMVDLSWRESDLRIEVEAADFEGQHLSAEFTVRFPKGHEALGVAIPFSRRTFQYTCKQNTLPARGNVRLGRTEIPFDSINSFACLDFGRGIWPRNTQWNWASASGTRDGRSIGLNLGGQWTDGTGLTENAICVGGHLSKIPEDLVWEYDRTDFMKPWRIVARESMQVNLSFAPFLERVSRLKRGPIHSETHQLFGYYSGVVRTEEAESILVEDLVGWVEDHRARW